jgi:hypothetical protein
LKLINNQKLDFIQINSKRILTFIELVYEFNQWIIIADWFWCFITLFQPIYIGIHYACKGRVTIFIVVYCLLNIIVRYCFLNLSDQFF